MITSAKKLSGGKWVKNSKGRRYKQADGTYVKNAWIKVSGKVYRISKKGYVETGWFTYRKKTYYAAPNGKVYCKKWLTVGKKKYYLQADGVRATQSWQKIKGKYYYFNKKGKLVTNRFIQDYFLDASGVRLYSTWIQKNGKRYYVDGSGKRLRSKWLYKNGKYYYFQANGVMAVDKQVDGYYIDKNGVRQGKVVTPFSGKYIFVGDSRMVGMKNSVSSSKVEYIAEVNSGYNYLQATAGPKLKTLLAKYPDAKVVLAHGVNDLGNINSYISYYKQLINNYPKAKFYILSVNPVDYAKGLNYGYRWVTNDAIKSFNNSLKANFSSRYIDTYTYLQNNGFGTSDGIHYVASTYQKLYTYIMNKIS